MSPFFIIFVCQLKVLIMKAIISILVAALIGGGAAAEAKVRLGSMFTDNMVLEQNENIRIFGQADPGAQVTVTP